MSLTSLDFARDFARSSLPTKATFSTAMRNAESDLLIKGPIHGDVEVFKRNERFDETMSEDADERPPVIKLQNETSESIKSICRTYHYCVAVCKMYYAIFQIPAC